MIKRISVLILVLETGKNLGDAVIGHSTRYILNKILKEKDVEYDLISRDLFSGGYRQEICEADLVVFAGGGLISDKYETIVKHINEVTMLADVVGTSVIFNAVGIEGYRDNEECEILIRALNRSCVKFISTRDDIDLLNEKFITDNSRIKSLKVADSAVWTSEVYNIRKNKFSNIIGIGVIRSGVFEDNGIDFNEMRQLELWSRIISELEEKKEEWVLFTNGLEVDYEFAVRILEYIGRSGEISNKIIKLPVDDEEFVRTISDFKGIIAARMHANIIAYSLDIPTIGIVWNPKLEFFGKTISATNRFFKIDKCNAINIVNELENAINQGYDRKFFNDYKETTYTSLNEYINQFIDNKIYYIEKRKCFSKKKIIVFGTGTVTQIKTNSNFYEFIEYFIDSDENKKNNMLFGKMIYTPEKLLEEDFNNIFVIVNTFVFYKEMTVTLKKIGLQENVHFGSLEYYCMKNDIDVYLPKAWKEREESKEVSVNNSSRWNDRIAAMSQFIDESAQVILDLGCGQEKLKKYLRPTINYVGVDYIKRKEDTIVCDFNNREFPKKKVDTAFVSGVFEYIVDTEWFINEISLCCNQFIISYNAFELRPECGFRKTEGFVNKYTTAELITLVQKYGFRLNDSRYFYPYQVLLNFEKI
ncbi:polysaccharide pyruvyl transferase family protein [Clostridium chromiireducens]|uniref:Polysaccharide pyruvyl transferase n=1 Tax=Clostridium chromiireducens TaxID=225345 RepID=A0A1V4IXL6_9CLOT|nr:polysaccharide pyruvyl transferase family protein [Clostridium chromiireducens]OPJ64514.1 polysaccharide pyruvyl transferase [Clostridium chromiireducens]